MFVGFDDNRSLGNGETGAVAAVPIFIDFMQEANKGYRRTTSRPRRTPSSPMIRGIREAFRPGTEPRVAAWTRTGRPPVTRSAAPARRSRRPGRADAPPAAGPRRRPPKKPEDVSGLF